MAEINTEVVKINRELKSKLGNVLKKLNQLSIECIKVDDLDDGKNREHAFGDGDTRKTSETKEILEQCDSGKVNDKKKRTRNRKKNRLESVGNSTSEDCLDTTSSIIPVTNQVEKVELSSHDQNLNSCDYPLVLTKETLLIFKLLYMTNQEREEFLIKQAKERQIVVFDKKSKLFRLNKRLEKIDNDENLSRRNQQRIYDRLDRQPRYDGPKIGQEFTFEGLVNQLLYGCDAKPDDILLKNKNTDNKNSSFATDENQQNLEDFVEKLIDKKLGYVVEGEVRISTVNNQEAYITYSPDERDIFIRTNILRQCALQGDRVKIFVKNTPVEVESIPSAPVSAINETNTELDDSTLEDEEEDTGEGLLEPSHQDRECLTGFVVTIVAKIHPRKCVGSLRKRNSKKKWILFQPRDHRMLNIKIRQETLPLFVKDIKDQEKDMLYLVNIIGNTHDELIGEVIEKIGPSGEIETENQAVILSNNLHPPTFSAEILAAIPSLPYQIPTEEYAYREDLRSACVFTIDPLTARDLDDALSMRIIDENTIEIGVHISDVTYFIPEGSLLDEIVKNHTTSIYLANKVYHMLPEALCMLCSLLPGQDKLAFSVFFNFNKTTGELLKSRFAKTIINSCSQLAYEHAQFVIENPTIKNFEATKFPMIYNGHTIDSVAAVIKELNRIAHLLRKNRMDNGALRIDQPKIRFDLDPNTGKPLSYYGDHQQAANYMIEDFMLLANQTVAGHIFEKYPEIAILRHHSPPRSHLIKAMTKKMEELGLTFDGSSPKAIRVSIERLVSKSSDPITTSAALNVWAAKIMTRAR